MTACHRPFVDIHCHLIPGIDDGAKSWDEALAMARMAVDDGIESVIVTPHQMGAYQHVAADRIRSRTQQLREFLRENEVPLQLQAGADVRVEGEMVEALKRDEILTLGDRGKHILLELPHEMYLPLEGLLEQLEQAGVVGILSHPERNQGLLKHMQLVERLVDQGCLMQVTAGSFAGAFGPQSQQMAEWMIQQRLAHFVATDAHGPKSRRPLLQRAFERVAQLSDRDLATRICCTNPAAVAEGGDVELLERPKRSRFSGWWSWSKAS